MHDAVDVRHYVVDGFWQDDFRQSFGRCVLKALSCSAAEFLCDQGGFMREAYGK